MEKEEEEEEKKKRRKRSRENNGIYLGRPGGKNQNAFCNASYN